MHDALLLSGAVYLSKYANVSVLGGTVSRLAEALQDYSFQLLAVLLLDLFWPYVCILVCRSPSCYVRAGITFLQCMHGWGFVSF